MLQINTETKLYSFPDVAGMWLTRLAKLSFTFIHTHICVFPKDLIFAEDNTNLEWNIWVWLLLSAKYFSTLFVFPSKNYLITRAHLFRYQMGYFVQKEVWANLPDLTNHFQRHKIHFYSFCFQLIKNNKTLLLPLILNITISSDWASALFWLSFNRAQNILTDDRLLKFTLTHDKPAFPLGEGEARRRGTRWWTGT